MAKASKIRASKQAYISPNQLTLTGFDTPFAQALSATNRWVVLAHRIPWDQIANVYNKKMRNGITGASHVNPRVVIGALIIKHMCNLSDEETILQIQENMYMQYFIGYSAFSKEAPFDPSLFVEIRKRLGVDEINAINERIYQLSRKGKDEPPSKKQTPDTGNESVSGNQVNSINENRPTHHGKLLVDATAAPQDIAYPTDLNILSDAREKSEMIIDCLYNQKLHGTVKPRTYRKKARQVYLRTAQKKVKSAKSIHTALGKQLRFLRRNIRHIHTLLDTYSGIPLSRAHYKYLLVIQEVYRQQDQMYQAQSHSVQDRIVSVHQPHVRPIVRGKERAKVEFGSKINVSLVNGFSFLDYFSWDAYNEGALLIESVKLYEKRNGFFPKEVLADKIYCNRENRHQLKTMGIRLKAKPLGRPSAVNTEHVSPGERNPIEGKFGQAKNAYGLNRIRARLDDTSASWVASIILVLNLVKLAGQAPVCLLRKLWQKICAHYEVAQIRGLLIQ